MAPDVDARFERLYGYLQDDVSRRRASVGLGLELCGLPSSSAYARSRLAPGAPLVDEYLVQVEENDRPVLTRPLRVPDRVAAHLLGSDIPDAVVAALVAVSLPPQGGASGGGVGVRDLPIFAGGPGRRARRWGRVRSPRWAALPWRSPSPACARKMTCQ